MKEIEDELTENFTILYKLFHIELSMQLFMSIKIYMLPLSFPTKKLLYTMGVENLYDISSQHRKFYFGKEYFGYSKIREITEFMESIDLNFGFNSNREIYNSAKNLVVTEKGIIYYKIGKHYTIISIPPQ
jgi:hypothetical protein